MLISLENNLAFLAMTKAGSTAIQAALGPHCDIVYRSPPRVKHMNVQRFERFMRPYLEAIGHGEIETLALIREPEDWLRSWYKYRARPALNGHENSTAHLSFDQFVEAYLSDAPPPFASVGRPSRFFAAPPGRPSVTHLFRYDAMDAAVAFLEERFGQRLSLKRVNVSPERGAVIDGSLKHRLHETMAADYRLYHAAKTTL